MNWPQWQHRSASFCFVLTAFIIHLYITLFFNMNNGGGIWGGIGMWKRGGKQHVSLAPLHFCSIQSGAGGKRCVRASRGVCVYLRGWGGLEEWVTRFWVNLKGTNTGVLFVCISPTRAVCLPGCLFCLV